MTFSTVFHAASQDINLNTESKKQEVDGAQRNENKMVIILHLSVLINLVKIF